MSITIAIKIEHVSV